VTFNAVIAAGNLSQKYMITVDQNTFPFWDRNIASKHKYELIYGHQPTLKV
jgi:hypothetical protein